MIVQTLAELENAVESLKGFDVIGYDLETTGLDPHNDTVLIIAIGCESKTYAIDVQAVGAFAAFSGVKKVLESSSLILIHNAVFDYKFTYHNKVRISNIHCTMVCENILTAGKVVDSRADLKSVAARYVNVSMDKTIRKDFTSGVKLEEHHFEYAANDVRYLFDIYKQQMRKVKLYALDNLNAFPSH